jgi:anti-sigma factor RsiW
MTHQEIEEKEIIERYVRHKLPPEERLAFQEHYFSCDECFERAQMEARFIAAARDASKSGVLAADRAAGTGMLTFFFNLQRWAAPALAAILLVAVAMTVLWALSLRRENRLLSARAVEQNSEAERLQRMEERIRELEANGGVMQGERENLKQEVERLKQQLAASEQKHETELAELRQPDVNVPVRNIFPSGDAQRSTRAGEVNRVRVPRATRTFVLILGDYKPGYAEYKLEISDASGQLIARRDGLKPDQSGELTLMLNRTLVGHGKYTLKLYGGQQHIASYIILVE